MLGRYRNPLLLVTQWTLIGFGTGSISTCKVLYQYHTDTMFLLSYKSSNEWIEYIKNFHCKRFPLNSAPKYVCKHYDRHRELQTEINFTHRSNVQTKLRKQVKCTCRPNETIRKTHSLHWYQEANWIPIRIGYQGFPSVPTVPIAKNRWS